MFLKSFTDMQLRMQSFNLLYKTKRLYIVKEFHKMRVKAYIKHLNIKYGLLGLYPWAREVQRPAVAESIYYYYYYSHVLYIIYNTMNIV